jgi:hypothetical protein
MDDHDGRRGRGRCGSRNTGRRGYDDKGNAGTTSTPQLSFEQWEAALAYGSSAEAAIHSRSLR